MQISRWRALKCPLVPFGEGTIPSLTHSLRGDGLVLFLAELRADVAFAAPIYLRGEPVARWLDQPLVARGGPWD